MKEIKADSWEFYWGGEANYDIAQDMEDLYEKVNGKSAVLWTPMDLKNGEHIVPTDTLEGRPEVYSTHGYTGDFEDWGIRLCKKGCESGVRTTDDMTKFFYNMSKFFENN